MFPRSPASFLRLLLPTLFSILFASCGTFRDGASQTVTIKSHPTGATVFLEDKPLGQTPLHLSLSRKRPHTLRIEHAGFHPATREITPTPNAHSADFVRFGLAADAGLYLDLAPNPLEVFLEPTLITGSQGADPYAQLAAKTLEADRLLANGEISQPIHRYIIERLLLFYSR